jgi:transcriptional regulator with XRE-family HTH domain
MTRTFGKLIRQLRKQKGFSAYALAQRVGVSDQAIHGLEKGSEPSLETVRRLAAVLEFSIDELCSQLPPIELPKLTPGRPRGRPKKATPTQ